MWETELSSQIKTEIKSHGEKWFLHQSEHSKLINGVYIELVNLNVHHEDHIAAYLIRL